MTSYDPKCWKQNWKLLTPIIWEVHWEIWLKVWLDETQTVPLESRVSLLALLALSFGFSLHFYMIAAADQFLHHLSFKSNGQRKLLFPRCDTKALKLFPPRHRGIHSHAMVPDNRVNKYPRPTRAQPECGVSLTWTPRTEPGRRDSWYRETLLSAG